MKHKTRSILVLVAILAGVLALLGLGHVTLNHRVAAEGASSLLIAALHYDPAGESEASEAFRLVNVTEAPLDLAGWSVVDGQATLSLTGTLDAGATLWISAQAAEFAAAFGFAPDFEYAADSDGTPNLVLSGTLTLDNAGGQLAVLDGTGGLVDAVVYAAAADTPPEGSLQVDWVGPPIAPYTRPGFAGEGQVLYRKLDPATARPLPDTNSAADWAQADDDDLLGKRVQYPGWDLERYLIPATITETATITLSVAPDGTYEAVRAQIERATESLYFEGHTLPHTELAEAIVARLHAHPGMTVTLLLDGAPQGGITDQQRWVAQQIEEAGGQVYFLASDSPGRPRYGALYGRFLIVDERALLIGAGDVDHLTMPADGKADGTVGRRGFWMIAEAPGAVAHALDVFRHDLDPVHHNDLVRWSVGHPVYGAPAPEYEPARLGGGTWYSAPYTTPFSVQGMLGLTLIQAPENSLRADSGVLGLVGRLGAGDRMWVVQSYEPPHWGPIDGTPEQDPNPRLEAYLDAARRGAMIKLLLDRSPPGGGPPTEERSADNRATCAYVNRTAEAEGIDIACRLSTPMGAGIGANALLVFHEGRGYVHLGSIDGAEATAKDSRALAVQFQSDEAYYYLAWKAGTDWNNTTYNAYLPIAIQLHPVSSEPADEFAYAIQAHGEHGLPDIVTSAEDLGVTWIKQQVRWEQIEGTQGDYGWAGLDYIADSYNDAGFKVLFGVTAAPQWTRPDKSGSGPPDDYTHFFTFMSEMAAHFRGRVHAYEVWNEPNATIEWDGARLSASDYVRLLQGAYAAIKAADPDAIVLSAAPTPTGINDGVFAIDDRIYLRQAYEAGMREYCDAVGVHPYGYANPPDVLYTGGDYDPTRGWDDRPHFFFRNTMQEYYAIMVEYGDGHKTLWATEFGWPTIDGMFVPPSPGQEYAADITEGQQADYTVRAFAWSREWGHAGVMFLWNLNYWPASGPWDEKAKYSLVRGNWTPRPVYEAYRDMEK